MELVVDETIGTNCIELSPEKQIICTKKNKGIRKSLGFEIVDQAENKEAPPQKSKNEGQRVGVRSC